VIGWRNFGWRRYRVNRRTFLKGVAGAVALMLAPAPIHKLAERFAPRLVLWGDGVHDDAPALNAMLRGEDVEVRDSAAHVEPGMVWLAAGTYRLGSTLHFDGKTGLRGLTATDSTFAGTADPLIRVDLPDAEGFKFHHNTVTQERGEAI